MIKSFESPRLQYDKITSQDFEFFYEIYSNKEVMKYSYQDVYTSLEQARWEFEKILASTHDMLYSIKIQWEKDVTIGFVGYHTILSYPEWWIIEIGYILKEDYWGQWYGTEAWKSIIDTIFWTMPVHKVTATCNINNVASGKILEKLQMKKEWIARKARYKNNEWVDEVQYGILKEEWIK